jgi:hypothetical protein
MDLVHHLNDDNKELKKLCASIIFKVSPNYQNFIMNKLPSRTILQCKAKIEINLRMNFTFLLNIKTLRKIADIYTKNRHMVKKTF